MSPARLRAEHRQAGFRVRFDWGPNGLRALAPMVEIVVVVDVLSFSTSVDIAVGRGAVVLPYRWHNGTEASFAVERDALLARRRGEDGFTLSPSSLEAIPAGSRLVLPSPNGSALSFGAREAGAERVVVASLRNAGAVGQFVARTGDTVGVVASGERWRGDTGPIRPAVEDLLGAGAVIAAIPGDGRSPEAAAAAAAFDEARPSLAARLPQTASGRELIAGGFARDVTLAAEHDRSGVVPVLVGDEIVDALG